jgi:hypothetical protein
MRAIDEARFRDALDPHGLLRENALALPPRDDAFIVFAQQSDARIAIDDWRRHAERFLSTRIGLTVDKGYGERPPRTDAARVVVVPPGAPSETRLLWGRPRTDDDIDAAEDADGGGGLALLAKRCGQVWMVECERDEDPVALRLAAIVAGVALGPILSPGGKRLFGPKTARQALDAIA